MPKNLNQLHYEKSTFGQISADKVSKLIGSWGFIISIIVFMLFWVVLNVYAAINSWDPYPFILLNLFLSVTAAVEAPIILMSQNRMDEKDRLRAELDFETNLKAEREIEEIKSELKNIKATIERLADVIVYKKNSKGNNGKK